MPRYVDRKSHKAGLSPGTLEPVGVAAEGEVEMDLLEYDSSGVEERRVQDLGECRRAPGSEPVSWLNVNGLHDTELVGRVGELFGLHPLVTEDVVNAGQRPKVDDYDDYLFLALRMLTFDRQRRRVRDEQVSLALGPRWVVSFQESPGDVFDPVRDRIRQGKGRIRSMGPDYLAYSLVDAVVDNYFGVLEELAEWVEAVEDDLLREPDEEVLEELYRLKRETLLLRKAAWPAREVASALSREESPLLTSDVRLFVRDLYDHTVQVIDTTETVRELISGMRDTYLSTVSNRMNEVMQVLTVMASLFIPLTFIAGVYGMNFQFMPELGWRWGYPAVLGLMGFLAGGMLIYFRRRGWL